MGQKESNSQANESLSLWQRTYNDFYTRFRMIACTLFKWENLPPLMSEIYMEKVLYEMGQILFFKDKEKGFMISRCTMNNRLNHQEEPTGYVAYSPMYHQEYNVDDCVIIRNNSLIHPTDSMIRLYATRLTEIERSMDTNIMLQKFPWVITCEESQRLSMVNFMKKVQGSEPVIYGVKGGLQTDSINVLNTNTPYVADKLQEHKENLIAELYTRLGLNNANTDKRERLIVDEVNSNNEVIAINYLVMLKEREKAVELINKKYGLDIKVSLRYQSVQEGETENGNVHNNDQNAS